MRLDDAFQSLRERRARGRGHVPTVLPYTGYGSTRWIRVLARVIIAKPDTSHNPQLAGPKLVADGIRGWRNFISATVPGAVVLIDVAGARYEVRADRGGVLDVEIPAALPKGWNVITLRCADSEPVQAQIYVVPDDVRFGVISDVDDTVMVTALPRPMLAAWNSFVLDEHARTPTPGMAVMLERVSRGHAGSPVIYLSTGAWNVAQTLTRFLTRNLYPPGPLLLTDWGPTAERWFRSGGLHKRIQLERLAREFPTIKWLLLGDDGQHDEMIYEGFVQRYPEQVAAVVIRQLSVGEAVLAGGRSQPRSDTRAVAVPWIYAPDGAGIVDKLIQLGILGDEGRRA